MDHRCIVNAIAPSEDYWATPRTAFCGKRVGEKGWHNWVFAADVEHSGKPVCEDCLASDDWTLFLLGSVGDDVRNIFDGISSVGTQTGRLSSSQPNISNVIREVKDATDRMRFALEAKTFEMILSPADYAALEKDVLERTGKK